jgi:hypothetical protein
MNRKSDNFTFYISASLLDFFLKYSIKKTWVLGFKQKWKNRINYRLPILSGSSLTRIELVSVIHIGKLWRDLDSVSKRAYKDI